jgi:flagellar biosynthesis/type III secretory pathway protein FliH
MESSRITQTDEDDFFGNQDEHVEEALLPSSHCSDGLAEREWRATNEQFRNMGYLQAYDESKEERLQEGFEAGYKQYFEKAMRLGEVLGEVTSPLLMQENMSHEKRQQVNQVVQSIRLFLTHVQTNESDANVSTESLESLTEQLSELLR